MKLTESNTALNELAHFVSSNLNVDTFGKLVLNRMLIYPQQGFVIVNVFV